MKALNSWKKIVTILASFFLPLSLSSQDFDATQAEITSQPGDILMQPNFTGQRKILFISVRYPDAPAIVTISQLQEHKAIVKDRLERFAYGSLSVTIDIVGQSLMMPNPVSYYQESNTTVRIRDDAVTVAKQAGFDIDSYDREVIFSSKIWAGANALGTMNRRTALMSHNLDYITIHELGHSFGWRHTNFWEVSAGSSPISPNGQEIEYGDAFDIMGNFAPSVVGAYHHFNPWLKYRIGWLPQESILNVTTSGTYTIQALDSAPQTGGSVTKYTALKIRKDAFRDYWVFFRSLEPLINYGPVITEIYNDNIRATRLLDMTPGSQSDDWRDAALAVNSTFSDTQAEISVKTVSVSSGEVQVEVTVDPDILANLDKLPVMDVVNPPDGAVQGVVDYQVTAFDPDFGATNGAGINKIDLFLSRGNDLLGAALKQGMDPPDDPRVTVGTRTFFSSPYSWQVDTSPIEDGIHFLVLKATSDDGGVHYVWWEHVIDNLSLPATPVLLSPNDNAIDVSTSPILTWNAANSADSYEAQVSTVADFSTITIAQSEINSTSFQLPNLSSSTTYYWRAQARNAVGPSGWSTVWQFTTAGGGGAPATPTLSSPVDNATDVPTNPTFVWNPSSEANSYNLQVSTESNFSTTVVDQSGLTSTSFQSPVLANNTTYFWRLSATNANGTSSWSSIWQFTTIIAAPSAPVLSGPADNATDVSVDPTLMWNDVSDAASYQVQVSTQSGFGTTVADQSGITESSFKVTGLAGETTYFWRVRAVNAGGTSDWSHVRRFTTEVVTSVENPDEMPGEFRLGQNYPNPFNPTTDIVFELPRREFVTLKIYTVLGKEIATIVSDELQAGRHVVTFDAHDLSSGIYLYQIRTNSFVQTRKMLLVR